MQRLSHKMDKRFLKPVREGDEKGVCVAGWGMGGAGGTVKI